jgi:hypothetical protein
MADKISERSRCHFSRNQWRRRQQIPASLGNKEAGRGGLNTQDWPEVPASPVENSPLSRFNELFYSFHILAPYPKK